MRTTLDIDPDVLAAARELAQRRGASIGRILSDLARRALVAGAAPLAVGEPVPSFHGFQPFPARGVVVDNETIDRLRDQEGV
ncbi:MAG: ribbon-helix-helix domain-containing protein [Burkholderiaceae bacterium]|nr:ribbon-helix-helix domain-containing protein [Burkholderiaceae bacterium]